MGNVVNTTSSSVEDMQKFVDNLAKKSVAEQAAYLKDKNNLFIYTEENTVSSSKKSNMEANKKMLQEKQEEYEEKLADLDDKLSKKQDEIDKKTKAIADALLTVQDKTKKWEEDQKKVIRDSVVAVNKAYANGQITKNQYSSTLATEIQRRCYGLNDWDMQQAIKALETQSSGIKELTDGVTGLIDERRLLDSQYTANKSALGMVTTVLNKVGNTETNYTNSDYDTNRPIYSPQKLAAFADVTANYKVDSGVEVNKNYTIPSYAEKLATLNQDGKYNDIIDPETSKGNIKGGDSTKIGSKANQALNAAVKNGLLDDMLNAGFTQQEMSYFFATNFKGSGFTFEDNKFVSNIGHDGQTKELFKTVRNKVKEAGTGATYINKENTWNTITNNAQLQKLSENNNYKTILDGLYNEPNNFTFKEAMYALFNNSTGVFKDTGIVYNLDEQTGTPNYSLVPAGDKETLQLYKNIAKVIKDNWGVDLGFGNGNGVEFGENDVVIGKKDPMTFQMGDTHYSFIVDRDGDGSFNNMNELAGADANSTWYDDLKQYADADGVIRGENLKKVMLLGTAFKDEDHAGIQDHVNDTNVGYSIVSAASLGITEIRLGDLVNQSTGNFDLNDSEEFSDSIGITLENGSELTATRKDDTDYYMEHVYAGAVGKSHTVGVTEDEMNDILNWAKTDENGNPITTDGKYSGLLNNLNYLKNAEGLVESVKEEMSQAESRVSRYSRVKQNDANNEIFHENNKIDDSEAAIEKDYNNSQKIFEYLTEGIKQGVVFTQDQIRQYIKEGLTIDEAVEKFKEENKIEEEDTKAE